MLYLYLEYLFDPISASRNKICPGVWLRYLVHQARDWGVYSITQVVAAVL